MSGKLTAQALISIWTSWACGSESWTLSRVRTSISCESAWQRNARVCIDSIPVGSVRNLITVERLDGVGSLVHDGVSKASGLGLVGYRGPR